MELSMASARVRHDEALDRKDAVHLFSDELPIYRLVHSWLLEQKLEDDMAAFEAYQSAPELIGKRRRTSLGGVDVEPKSILGTHVGDRGKGLDRTGSDCTRRSDDSNRSEPHGEVGVDSRPQSSSSVALGATSLGRLRSFPGRSPRRWCWQSCPVGWRRGDVQHLVVGMERSEVQWHINPELLAHPGD